MITGTAGHEAHHAMDISDLRIIIPASTLQLISLLEKLYNYLLSPAPQEVWHATD